MAHMPVRSWAHCSRHTSFAPDDGSYTGALHVIGQLNATIASLKHTVSLECVVDNRTTCEVQQQMQLTAVITCGITGTYEDSQTQLCAHSWSLAMSRTLHSVEDRHSLVPTADHSLNLALVSRVDLLSVLRPHEHGCILVSRGLHVRPLALHNCGGEYRHNVVWETCDVSGHPYQHSGCTLQCNHKT